MLEILANGAFRDAAAQILALLSNLLDINTLFVAANDQQMNYIVSVHNKNDQLVTAGSLPLPETYCSLVCQQDDTVLIIADTSSHPATANMDITQVIGATTFIGIAIVRKDGTSVGTRRLCTVP